MKSVLWVVETRMKGGTEWIPTTVWATRAKAREAARDWNAWGRRDARYFKVERAA